MLPHDILYQICSILAKRTEEKDYYSRKSTARQDLPALIALSSTSKAIREVCFPFLFDEISIAGQYGKKDTWEEPLKKLEALNGEADGILRFVKYVLHMCLFMAPCQEEFLFSFFLASMGSGVKELSL